MNVVNSSFRNGPCQCETKIERPATAVQELGAVSLVHQPPQQGLTLVHISAQLKRLLWGRSCTQGLFRVV